jgi:acyl-CoA synthetase (AMP-forming)/AMP-acid ligase II
MNHNNWIISRLKEFEKDIFSIYNDHFIKYSDLIAGIKDWIKRLNQLGITRGQGIAIIGDYSPGTIFLFMALIINKNIIVPLSYDKKNRDKFFSLAEVNGYFEFGSNDRWVYHSIAGISGYPGHQLLSRLRSDNDAGFILFSSGTTGEHKASVLQGAKILEKYREFYPVKRKAYRTLIFLKFDHIGGINTLFSIMLKGGTIVSCAERDPQSICQTIEKYKVQLLPTTPTFLNMLIISTLYKKYDLSSLELITYGTEPMPASTLKAVNEIFKSAKIKQTYGLTELGILATKSHDSNSNWMKIGGKGIEWKVIDNILRIRARSAMLGYLNAPSPFDPDGWYNTGDVVEMRDDYMRILGRKEEIINVGGEKVYPAEVESVILEMPNIKEVVVSGKKNPITGQIVTATIKTIKPEKVGPLKKRIIGYCRERMEKYKVPSLIAISEDSLMSDRFKKIRPLNEKEAV